MRKTVTKYGRIQLKRENPVPDIPLKRSTPTSSSDRNHPMETGYVGKKSRLANRTAVRRRIAWGATTGC